MIMSGGGSGNRQALALAAALTRISLGGIFAYAALVKLADPIRLADDIANYRLLPAQLVPWAAAVLPGIELVVAAALVFGLMIRAAAALVALMVSVFIAAICLALARGLSVDCGCFGGEGSADVSVIGRDVVLLMMALFVAAADRGLWSIRRHSTWARTG